MGTDIGGWVEARVYNHWHGIVTIDTLIVRHYDMFGCLFGIRNYASFQPIVPLRGVPDDKSWEFEHYSLWAMSHSHTWISWQEIKRINWDEEATKADERIHAYYKAENGEWVKYAKAAGGFPHPPEGETSLQVGNELYRIEKLKRRDVLTQSWQTLFKLMEVLAAQYDDDNVRLVVYFDS